MSKPFLGAREPRALPYLANSRGERTRAGDTAPAPAILALHSHAEAHEQRRPRVRRFAASAWRLECARRGLFRDFAAMPKADADRLRRSHSRYRREAWSHVFLFQRVKGLPLVERDARSFGANAREHVAASDVDRLSDLLAAAITDFRRECEHIVVDAGDGYRIGVDVPAAAQAQLAKVYGEGVRHAPTSRGREGRASRR